MKNKWLIHALALTLPICACSQTPAESAVQQAPAPTQAASMTAVSKAQGIWIDVRTADEYGQGHLAGAVNVPHEQIGAQIGALSSDKNAPIHLYCRSGSRAEVALQELKKLGYTNVSNHGAYDDLVKKGLR